MAGSNIPHSQNNRKRPRLNLTNSDRFELQWIHQRNKHENMKPTGGKTAFSPKPVLAAQKDVFSVSSLKHFQEKERSTPFHTTHNREIAHHSPKKTFDRLRNGHGHHITQVFLNDAQTTKNFHLTNSSLLLESSSHVHCRKGSK